MRSISTGNAHAWLSILVAVLGLSTGVACSSDSTAQISQAGSSGSGGASSGGRSGAPNDSGSAATGSGGAAFDAAAAAACGVDVGAGQCELCLETICCDDFKACIGDPTCRSAFSTYRSCILKPDQMDQPKCFSAFLRTGNGDAGNHDALFNCLFLKNPGCQICGGVSIL